MVVEKICEPVQQATSFDRRRRAPCSGLEGLPCRGHSEVDIARVRLRDLSNLLACGRVKGWERFAGLAIDPFVIDQQLRRARDRARSFRWRKYSSHDGLLVRVDSDEM